MVSCRCLKNLISHIQSANYPPFSLSNSRYCRYLSIGRQTGGAGLLTVQSKYFHSAMFLKKRYKTLLHKLLLGFTVSLCFHHNISAIQPLWLFSLSSSSSVNTGVIVRVNRARCMQGKAGELRIFLQVLIVSRAHLSDGDPELGEMIQIQPVGVFEDSFLEHWLNFLPVRHHLHDGKVTTNDIKPGKAEENKDIFVITKLLPADVVIVKDGVLHNVQVKPCDNRC